jgi:hypothetical protein
MNRPQEQMEIMTPIAGILEQIQSTRVSRKEQYLALGMLRPHLNCEINPGKPWHRYIRYQ